MIISRKKYEEALEKARKEGAEKAWEQQHIAQTTNELHHRIDHILDRIERMEKERTCSACPEEVAPPAPPRPCFCFGGVAVDA